MYGGNNNKNFNDTSSLRLRRMAIAGYYLVKTKSSVL